MLYESTRGEYKNISFSDVIKMGISPDGGLFVPMEDVYIEEDQLFKMVNMDYRQRAVEIMKYFASDFSRRISLNVLIMLILQANFRIKI